MRRLCLAILLVTIVFVLQVAACRPSTTSDEMKAPPQATQPHQAVEEPATSLPALPTEAPATEPVPVPTAEPTPPLPPAEAPSAPGPSEPMVGNCNPAEAAWIGTFGFGLNCLDGAGWHLYTEDGASISNQIADLAICPDGGLWVVHSFGASRTDGQSWNSFRDAWGYASPAAVACDGAGGVWVAHYEGVSHYDGSQWTTYEASQLGTGPNVSLVKDVAVAADGAVWVATANSVAGFDGQTWTVYETGKGFDKDYYFEAVAVDDMGRVWAAHSSGVWRFDGTGWVPHEGRHLSSAKSLLVDAQGRVWAGTTSDGVSVHDSQGWVTYDRENSGLSSNQVRALATDAQGRIWLGTEWGLDVLDGHTWQTYHMHTSGLADDDIYALAVSGNGPALPGLVEKETGSLSGKIVRGSVPIPGASVEACAEFVGMLFSGPSPCADMAFHVATVTGDDGTFRFADLPEGRYSLAFQAGEEGWARLTGRFGIGDKKLTVQAGQETSLSDIDISQ